MIAIPGLTACVSLGRSLRSGGYWGAKFAEKQEMFPAETGSGAAQLRPKWVDVWGRADRFLQTSRPPRQETHQSLDIEPVEAFRPSERTPA